MRKRVLNSYDVVLSVEDVKELISWGENYKSKCLFMTTSELITLIKQAKSKD